MVRPAGMPFGFNPIEFAPAPAIPLCTFFSTMIACTCITGGQVRVRVGLPFTNPKP